MIHTDPFGNSNNWSVWNVCRSCWSVWSVFVVGPFGVPEGGHGCARDVARARGRRRRSSRSFSFTTKRTGLCVEMRLSERRIAHARVHVACVRGRAIEIETHTRARARRGVAIVGDYSLIKSGHVPLK